MFTWTPKVDNFNMKVKKRKKQIKKMNKTKI